MEAGTDDDGARPADEAAFSPAATNTDSESTSFFTVPVIIACLVVACSVFLWWRLSVRHADNELVRYAAAAIHEADILILFIGAGMSKDSRDAKGQALETFEDIDARLRARGSKRGYQDLSDPMVMRHEPEVFFGFIGAAFNAFQDAQPHAGYGLIKSWAENKRHLRVFSSNVDGHAQRAFGNDAVVHEWHGSALRWQCARFKECPAWKALGDENRGEAPPLRWVAPKAFRFDINAAGLAVDGRNASASGAPAGTRGMHDHSAFAWNWPRCVYCGKEARPSELLFNDKPALVDEGQGFDWNAYREALTQEAKDRSPEEPLRVVALEVGAGKGNVATVREESEDVVTKLRNAGAAATLVRINPTEPFARYSATVPHTVPLPLGGLEALQSIDKALRSGDVASPEFLKEVRRRLASGQPSSRRDDDASAAEEPPKRGGLYKFDATEVDVHGGKATLDDFFEAFDKDDS